MKRIPTYTVSQPTLVLLAAVARDLIVDYPETGESVIVTSAARYVAPLGSAA